MTAIFLISRNGSELQNKQPTGTSRSSLRPTKLSWLRWTAASPARSSSHRAAIQPKIAKRFASISCFADHPFLCKPAPHFARMVSRMAGLKFLRNRPPISGAGRVRRRARANLHRRDLFSTLLLCGTLIGAALFPRLRKRGQRHPRLRSDDRGRLEPRARPGDQSPPGS